MNHLDYKRSCFLSCGLLILIGSAAQAAVQVRLGTNSLSGAPSAWIDGQPAKVRPGESMLLNQVRLQLSPKADGFTLDAGETNLVVAADNFPGWSAQVGARGKGFLRANDQQGVLEFNVLSNSTAPVLVQLPDGATAKGLAGSVLRFDLSPGGGYTLAGQGACEAMNSDGATVSLGEYYSPMAGGPLVQTTENGQKYLKRLVPVTDVVITGRLGSRLALEIGGQTFSLDADQGMERALPNGSAIFLKQDLSKESLRWEVRKGVFNLTLGAIPGWKTVGVTGQTGDLIWEESTGTVDLKNTAPAGSVLISLPSETWVRVDPSGSFQFTRISFSAFATAAYGAPVSLFHARSGEITDLLPANLIFKGGRVVPRSVPSLVTENKIILSWRNGAPLQIDGIYGLSRLAPGSSKSFSDPELRALEISYSAHGVITVAARSGSFHLFPEPLGKWGCTLSEGQSVSLSLTDGGKQFTMRAGADNVSPVVLDTPDGQHPQLNPGAAINFSGTGGNLAQPNAAVVFFSGGGNFGLGLLNESIVPNSRASGFAETLGDLEVPRIPQSPVSVVR